MYIFSSLPSVNWRGAYTLFPCDTKELLDISLWPIKGLGTVTFKDRLFSLNVSFEFLKSFWGAMDGPVVEHSLASHQWVQIVASMPYVG